MSQVQLDFHLGYIQQYKKELNRFKEVKQQLISQCSTLHEKILKELQKIKKTQELISKGAQLQTRVYNQSLNSDHYSAQVINLSALSSYLKRQKVYLAELVNDQQNTKNIITSGKDLLHKLTNRKKYERYLQHLQCCKLQKQIQYLQKNILVGKSKGGNQGLIYEDIPSITLKEQKQLDQKLKSSLQQLQRVVKLSNQCGGNHNSKLSQKVAKLNNQVQRLQNVEQMLDRQTKQIVQVKDFFKNYEPKAITQFLSQSLNYFQKQSASKHPKDQNCQADSENYFNQMDKDEVQFILNFDTHTDHLQIFKKPFDQVNDLVKSCKNRLKKVII